MATIFKRLGKNAPKGAKWMISWFDSVLAKWRHTTGYTDAKLSQAKGDRLERESVLRREGFTSNEREHSVAPIDTHIEAFINTLKRLKRDPSYMSQLEGRIRRLLKHAKATRLIDITSAKIDIALMSMETMRPFQKTAKPLSVTTQNEYLNSIMQFTEWAKGDGRMLSDPLAAMRKADENEDEAEHPRRAITPPELGKLLHSAMVRPVNDLLIVRRGPRKGTRTANVREHVLLRAKKKGLQRRMAYFIAMWTGLRRTELTLLEWGDVLLDAAVPHIQLRASMTKSGRADMLILHSQIVAELRAYRPADAQVHDRVLPIVPDMDVLKLDLKHAGIDYGNKEVGFADLHSMRKSLNSLMAADDVSGRARQSQLRHSDPKLTETTYWDKSIFLLPQAEQMNKAAPIPTPDITPEMPSSTAQSLHKTGFPEGLSESSGGTDEATTPPCMEGDQEPEKPENPSDNSTK